MSEALRFAAALTLGVTLDSVEGESLGIADGVRASWSGHEWRMCPECRASALVKVKAKNPKCRQCRDASVLVTADEFARRPGPDHGPCTRRGCDRPARAFGACDICAQLLAHPEIMEHHR